MDTEETWLLSVSVVWGMECGKKVIKLWSGT